MRKSREIAIIAGVRAGEPTRAGPRASKTRVRRGAARASGFCLVIGLLSGLLRARAEDLQGRPDPGERRLFLIQPASARGQPASQRLVQDYAARTGLSLAGADRAEDQDARPEASPEELAVLRKVERALHEARTLSAELREAAALRVLAGAEQDLLGALALPGVQAFLAEVYVQLALCAAQLDEQGLFESALGRALSLDPNRRIEAAEAPPAIVARARALAQSRDQAGLSENQLEVLLARGAARFDPAPREASVWLDGQPIDAGTASFRARAGAHVLLVRAPGHAPYAALITLEPGRRAPLSVALSPTPSELARGALLLANTPKARETSARSLAEARGLPVLLFEIGAGPSARALIQPCRSSECEAASGFDETAGVHAPFADRRSARAWLDDLDPTGVSRSERPTNGERRPIWQRWPLWVGTGALLLAGVATAVWVARPAEQRPERSLEIDASALPR